MRALIDTNVLLDVLAERVAFYAESMRVWSLAESNRLDGRVAAVSFTHCFYVVRKHAGRQRAEKAIRLLRDVFKVVDLTGQILNQAIDAGLSDFEDAVQFHSAIHADAVCIITRNPDHFPRMPLSILTPAEFLAAHSLE